MASLPIALDHAPTSKAHLTGIACGAGAGALWGLVFLAPELVRGFNPLLLTVGRYIFYGLISLALIAPRWGRLAAHVTRRNWLHLFWLALAGNTIYYIFLSLAVQTGGVAMASLVMGFLPVAVTIIGSREHNAVPLRKLAPSLLLCIAGTICIGWQVLAGAGAQSASTAWLGLLYAIIALAIWTSFAIGNARCLVRLDPRVSAQDWNLLTGIVTGAQSLLLIPIVLAIGIGEHSAEEWTRLAAIALGIAILASVVGNALWNRMSQLLPLTLVGQMILFETLFALIYGFAWESRWPTALEAAAFLLVVASVLSCLAAHRRPGGAPVEAA